MSYEKHFQDFEEWRRQAYAYPGHLDAQIERVYSNAADYMVQIAQSLCPVQADAPFHQPPGTLRDSIRKEITTSASDFGDVTATRVIEGNSAAFYGSFVEFGTHASARGKHPATAPHPHYFPAYQLAKQKIFQDVAAIEAPTEKAPTGIHLAVDIALFPVRLATHTGEL